MFEGVVLLVVQSVIETVFGLVVAVAVVAVGDVCLVECSQRCNGSHRLLP